MRSNQSETESEYIRVPIDAIDLGERRREDYGDIAKLAAGIEKVGLLHAPIVRQDLDGTYTLVVGGRRLMALRLLDWRMVPVRLAQTLTGEEIREIELEENENRKDFTGRERGRTFEAAKTMLADVVKAAEVIRSTPDPIKTKTNPKGAGPKTKGNAKKSDVAEALGVSKATLINAEHHVETAEAFPFMQGAAWRQSHVLAVREQLERIPEDERNDVAGVLGCAKILDPESAVDLVMNIAAKTASERQVLYNLSRSNDPRDRSNALSSAAELPPVPDPRLNCIDTALSALGRATKPFPDDPLTPEIRRIAAELRVVKTQVEAVSYDARKRKAVEVLQ